MARGVLETDADTARLGVVANPYPGHERYRGMLSIPYLDRQGKALTVRFRCIEEHEHNYHGKYNTMPGDTARMYNIRAIHDAGDEIHVAEGEFDAIVLTKIGLPAVAIPGASMWRGHHRRMLAGFSRVYVWGDPDDAGADFTSKVMRSMHTAKGVRLKHGDVTDTYMAGGPSALHALIDPRKE